MLGLRTASTLAFALALACGGESSDGDTDTDGSTGADGDGGSNPSSRSASNADGGSLTFTGAPPSDDDGRDDGNDSDPPDPDTSGGRDTDAATSSGTDTGMATGGDTGGPADTGNASDSSGLPDGGDCCEAQQGPGCGGGDVEDCVCMEDDFCCSTVWDAVCSVQVVTLGCAACEGIGGGGDCCSANGTPGCDDDAIEACVCNVDFVCCTQDWDMLCVDAVEAENCGMCP